MTTSYRATFSNGLTLTRKSKDHGNYTHAWIAYGVRGSFNKDATEYTVPAGAVAKVLAKGFSSSPELARKAAEAAANRWNSPFGTWAGMASAVRAANRAKNAKFAAEHPITIEIVPVEVVA